MQAQRTGLNTMRSAHGPSLSRRTSAGQRSRTVVAPKAFMVGGGSGSVASDLSTATSVVGGLVAAVGGFVLLQRELVARERLANEASNRRPCPGCNGRGYEACVCTRWSDNDPGCNSCSHTGYMRCRACGGGGMAVPIKVTIPVRSQGRE
ncbi:MAG: hypothetical protein J3K34DRAFT_423851 [Monoraphidium minutum]|nr:MAG: hypothetical protein J3K34DRAFT_423851 [Monoraphidium minutum]